MEKRNIATIIFLILIVIISSIPFLGKYLFFVDNTVNFALAINNFNIAIAQPHPPGYPIFVLLGKIIHYFIYNEKLSLTILAILFSTGTSIFMFKLVHFITKNYFTSIICTLLLIFNPLYWFHRELAVESTADSFGATIIIFLIFKIIFDNRTKYFYILMLILGILGGIRPSIIILLSPLVLYTLFYLRKNTEEKTFFNISNLDFRVITIGAFIFIISILVWLLPMIFSTGGIDEYLRLNSLQAKGSIESAKELSNNYIVLQIKLLFSFLITGILGIIIPLVASFIFIAASSKTKKTFYERNPSFNNNKFLPIIIISSIPIILFYSFVYFARPGYILILLPAFYLFASLGMLFFNKNILLKLILVFMLIAQSICFIFMKPIVLTAEGLKNITFVELLIAKVNKPLLFFNYGQIKENDRLFETIFSDIKKIRINNNLKSKDLLIIAPTNLRYHLLNREFINPAFGPHLTFYYPEVDVVTLEKNTSTYRIHKNYSSKKFFKKKIVIEPDKKKILIFSNKIDDNDLPSGGLAHRKHNSFYEYDFTTINKISFLEFEIIKK